MSIARCAASFACAALLLAIGGAVHAEEPAKKSETPPADATATPAPEGKSAASSRDQSAATSGDQSAPTSGDQSAATPAEPIPAAPATPPVMPTTVVRPSATQSAAAAPALPLSLGRYGAIELGHAPQGKSRWHGFPISLSLRDAPLPEVLRSFARIAGVNLVLSPGVTGNVTVELKDVPWDQALWVILKTQDMAAEIDGNVWSVAPY